MARQFLRIANNSALVDAAAVSSYPFCMGVWFKKSGGADDETLAFFGDKDTNGAYTRLYNTKLGEIAADSAHTLKSVVTSGTYNDNVWHSCLLVERVGGSIHHLDLYVDGLFIGSDNNSEPGALSFFDRLAFGRGMSAAPFDSLQGLLAEGFIAGIEPSVDQVAAWSRGASVRNVFGGALEGYWPLWGRHDPEVDLSGKGQNLTLSGTFSANHAAVASYTPRWAASAPAGEVATRRIGIDGVVISVAR